MNYAQIRKFDIANGNGIGCTLFLSGCLFHCKNCFNKEYQDFNYGNKFDDNVKNTFITYCKDKNVNHISILGGEIFQQDSNILLQLLIDLKSQVDKPIYIWTGYKFNSIPKKYEECLKYIDLVVDGQFIEELKDLKLSLRGSSNQQIYIKENGVFVNKTNELD